MSRSQPRLRGMAWDHVRGYGPMEAVAEIFKRRHPDCEVVWDRRSLKDFGDFPVAELAERYDLLLIDHPHVGLCAAQEVLAPLDAHVPEGYLADQAANSVGPSYASYRWEGRQWALPVDAAAQVASYRPDVLPASHVPGTWKQVRELAASLPAGRRIGWPLCPTDAMCSFLSLCAGIGGYDFFDADHGLPLAPAEKAARHLFDFLPLLHDCSLDANPIQMYDYMANHDDLVYVPLAFGYVNYAQTGFAPHRLGFADMPRLALGESIAEPTGSLLGGVGIAVSRFTRDVDLAAEFAMLAADPLIQRTLIFDGGGQPGHASAWQNERLNAASAGFFHNTWPTLHHSYMRPRHAVFPAFQEKAGILLHDALCRHAAGRSADPAETVREMNEVYRSLL